MIMDIYHLYIYVYIYIHTHSHTWSLSDKDAHVMLSIMAKSSKNIQLIAKVVIFEWQVIGIQILFCMLLLHSLWPHGLRPARLLCSWDSLGKNTGVVWSGYCYFLLQGIFPTQGSNLGLLHCRQILYQLSYEGSPFILYTYIFQIFPNKDKGIEKNTSVLVLITETLVNLQA